MKIKHQINSFFLDYQFLIREANGTVFLMIIRQWNASKEGATTLGMISFDGMCDTVTVKQWVTAGN